MNADTEGEGFVIKDNRSSQLSEEEVQDKSAEKEETKNADDAPPSEGDGSAETFQINFSTFVLSLASTAFYHLGDTPDPVTGEKKLNLPAVEQTIDMLKMLNQKTKGNLTAEEQKQLEHLIYELQMKYVEKK